MGSSLKQGKEALVTEVNDPDLRADSVSLSTMEWAHRYEHEDEFSIVAHCEELYWQQQARQQWILEGDVNTAFFQAVANGLRHRC